VLALGPSEIGGKSSFMVASMSTEASPSFLFFSDRQFSTFAESQSLFQRIFGGILARLRAFSRWLRLLEW